MQVEHDSRADEAGRQRSEDQEVRHVVRLDDIVATAQLQSEELRRRPGAERHVLGELAAQAHPALASHRDAMHADAIDHLVPWLILQPCADDVDLVAASDEGAGLPLDADIRI